MDKPLVSAVITTHNRLKSLMEAYDSVKSQTYPNMETIIVDDGSQDGTMEWARGIGDIKYVRIEPEASRGGNYARNMGIKASSGKYIAFLDDDDLWLSEKTERQVELLENNPKVGFVYCGMKIKYEDGKETTPRLRVHNGDVSRLSLVEILCTTSSMIVRRDTVIQAGLFDEDLKFWQETELVIRLSQLCEIGCVPEYLVIYYQATASNDPERLSAKFDKWIEAVDYINEKHKALIDALPEAEKRKRNELIYGDAANRCLLSRQFKKRREYKRLIYLNNRTFKNYFAYLTGIDKPLIWNFFHQR